MIPRKVDTPVKWYLPDSEMEFVPDWVRNLFPPNMTRLSQTIYYIHHPLPAAELNRWGKWDKGWSKGRNYIQPPALHIFHLSVFMSLFQHSGHHSLTSYPVHWFPLSKKFIIHACIFAMYLPSIAVLFLWGGEYNLSYRWMKRPLPSDLRWWKIRPFGLSSFCIHSVLLGAHEHQITMNLGSLAPLI